jgi:hypothetical protein
VRAKGLQIANSTIALRGQVCRVEIFLRVAFLGHAFLNVTAYRYFATCSAKGNSEELSARSLD